MSEIDDLRRELQFAENAELRARKVVDAATQLVDDLPPGGSDLGVVKPFRLRALLAALNSYGSPDLNFSQ